METRNNGELNPPTTNAMQGERPIQVLSFHIAFDIKDSLVYGV